MRHPAVLPDAAVVFTACYVDIDPLGGAVQRRLYSRTPPPTPPRGVFEEPVKCIDPICHFDALPGLGRKPSHQNQAVN